MESNHKWKCKFCPYEVPGVPPDVQLPNCPKCMKSQVSTDFSQEKIMDNNAPKTLQSVGISSTNTTVRDDNSSSANLERKRGSSSPISELVSSNTINPENEIQIAPPLPSSNQHSCGATNDTQGKSNNPEKLDGQNECNEVQKIKKV